MALDLAGPLAAVERAGFQTTWTDGVTRATGSLQLADLQRIADCDEVLGIRHGTQPELLLDKSIPQIKANQVWSLAGAVFSGQTGAGAIVGVIDSGCDIKHPFLWAQTIPDKATRIIRIWDQGLIKVGAETMPPLR